MIFFLESVIYLSVAHEFLTKLHCKTPLLQNSKLQSVYVQRYGVTKKSQNISKSLDWVTSKEKIARKRYVRKNKFSHINF